MRLIAFVLICYSSALAPADQIELVCLKKQKATNTCHYNFKVNGIDHNFEDAGCRYSKDKVVQKVEEGTIALAREWKVPCR